jgi:hypothetical protein
LGIQNSKIFAKKRTDLKKISKKIEMEECRADKNWPHFYKIEEFNNRKMLALKVVFSNATFLKETHFQKNQGNF